MMKKVVWTMAAAVMLLTLSGMTGQEVLAAENGWKDGYYYVDGKKQKSKWIKEGKDSYYLDSKGKKTTGWKKVSGSYYFFNAKGNNYKSGKPIGAKVTKLSKSVISMGIDASQWQGNVNWEKVKSAGVKFVMLRVGYGKGRYGSKHCTLDKYFEKYAEGAAEAGIPIGIYFYSYATTPEQAQKEAEYTIEQLDGIPVSFPVAYDIEDAAILKKTTKSERTEMARTFMETIAAAGYYPMYYCNQNWYNNYLDTDKLADYDFWYARYTHEEPDSNEYPFTMWQATSTQKLSGITDNTVDVNFLYKDYGKAVKKRTAALKYGWHTEGGKKRYYYQGEPLKSGWLEIAGEKYYFKDRTVSTGFRTINGKKYYFNSKGEMQTGFVKVSGSVYLFNDEGIMQMDTKEQGVTIDEDGVCHIKKGWYKDSKGKYFYRNSDGSLAKNKWITTKGKKYYVGSNRRRTIGFKTIQKKRYYFDKDGVMKKGWLTYKGHKYYFKKSGEMVKGKTIKIKGKKYTFKKNGQLK